MYCTMRTSGARSKFCISLDSLSSTASQRTGTPSVLGAHLPLHPSSLVPSCASLALLLAKSNHFLLVSENLLQLGSGMISSWTVLNGGLRPRPSGTDGMGKGL